MGFDPKAFEQTFGQVEASARNIVLPLHDRYVAGDDPVSTSEMAASVELCVFLFVLCHFARPRSILDLGSGVSSSVFRCWKQVSKIDARVVSVDTEESWLEKSRAFCADRLGDGSGFHLWGDPSIARHGYDLVLVDADAAGRRGEFFGFFLENGIRKGCLMVVDDMHKPVVQSLTDQFAERIPCRRHDIGRYTKDDLGRHAHLVEVA